MTDLAALEARRKAIQDKIAALSPDLGRVMPIRALPSSTATKINALNLQLKTVTMKIKLAQKAGK